MDLQQAEWRSEACWALNPEVRNSELRSATLLLLVLSRGESSQQ